MRSASRELRRDERAATNERRVGNRAHVDGAIAAAIARRSTAEVTETLNRAGVLVAPVRSAASAVEDPQVAALGLIDELDGVRFARTPLSQFSPARAARGPAARRGLGGRSSRECLDLDAAQLRSLIDDGVIQTAAERAAPAAPVAGAAQAAST